MSEHADIFHEGRNIELKMSDEDRKERGVFYTPYEIVKYMVESVLMNADILSNANMKLLDISCGAGYFLAEALRYLGEKYEERKSYIAKNVIWGVDIDDKAVAATKEAIYSLLKCRPELNIFCCDGVVFDEADIIANERFDYIIGNPPYIGHKKVTADYKKKLQKLYGDVYRDKSDISYCFIKRGIDLLKNDGILSFITSRYFMEGPSGRGLRSYIKSMCSVESIIDFGGYKVFEDAGVGTCIINLRKNGIEEKTKIMKLKPNLCDKSDIFSPENYDIFYISKDNLKEDGWLLLDNDRLEIYNKIEEHGTHVIEQLFNSYQGIITGCDRAFVVGREEIEQYRLEQELLRPWIKNSDVQKHYIKPSEKYIIYSDLINNPEIYPSSLNFISKHKESLENRRECKNGVRLWYQLQWGRKPEIFDSIKLVYPYKSSKSRFAVDYNKNYCSADVYSLIPKEDTNIPLEYICTILNSKLFQFYFKCYAKRISSDMYDYYPNTVLRMKLSVKYIDSELLHLSEQLMECSGDHARESVMKKIDIRLYRLYGLEKRHINLIEEEEKY